MNKLELDRLAANNIRILSAAMVEKANSGHPGGAMGGADFMHVLFTEFLNFDPSNMQWSLRDRFFLDPGHMSPLLYSTLALWGKYSTDELKNFRQWGSPTPGHPEVEVERGIENTSGPLGQGHTIAVGAAIAERFLVARFGEWMSHKIYAYISDGGVQEEISQGAGRIAGHLGLSNLIMFYDSNDIQLSTVCSDVTSEDTAKKYEAWGWKVISINGNNCDEIRKALNEANTEKERPVLIIGKTTMGKGALGPNGESFESKISTHGQPLSKAGASLEKTINNLGGNPADPFIIFPDVQEYYYQVISKKADTAKIKMQKQLEWEKANPELSKTYKEYLLGILPDIDYRTIAQKPNIASRVASGVILAEYAKKVGNMIVISADLSESDKTIDFLKQTKAFKKGDFSGAFLQAGVSELTMGAIANGMALHGGVIPVCATFFVFSDYIKPTLRLAALMELPVKYVYTHDSFRVGEDGPTHQPVEQEAQIRLMEKLYNHSGNRSVLVLRPADSTETTIAWKMALENKKSPTALILSRQNIKDLPVIGPSRYDDALNAGKGAYVVIKPEGNPDIILIASGSEVSTLVAAAELLKKDNIKAQVVSVISDSLFNDQTEDYKKKIVPENVPCLGLTAGLSVSLELLVGSKGKVIGVDHFGYSAPFEVLDEKFGINPKYAYEETIKFLKNK